MKTGIVFEGGALRTVFSCGIMDSFLDHKIMPNYIIGVSAGAAYAASYAAGQRGRDIKIIKKYSHDKRYVGLRNILNPKNRSIYGLDFTYNTIPNELAPFDFEAFRNYQGEFFVVVTNVLTGKAEYLPLDDHDREFTLLRATCALPMLFPFIYVNNTPYMDGGLSDSIPFEKALQDGCDRIVVILTRQKGYQKATSRSSKMIAYRFKKHPAVSKCILERAESYNACMKRLEQCEKEGKALVIRPTRTDGFRRLEKDLDKIQCLYNDGFRKGNDIAAEVKKYFEQ